VACGVRRCSWRRRISKDGVHGARCGARSSRGRRRGEHGRGRGRPSSPKPAIFDSRAPPSSPPRRRLLLPCAGEADCHGSTPAPPSLLSLAAMAGQRRPSAPSLPLRPHSPLLPAPHPLDGHGARCVGGARPQAWVRPTSPSLAATAPPGRACCPVAGRRQLLCPGSRAGSSWLASLLRAEPSLLNELAKGPSRARLGSSTHRAAPSRAEPGSARLVSSPTHNCQDATGCDCIMVCAREPTPSLPP